MKVLAGDVGGTKILLAVVEATGAGLRLLEEERLDSGEYAGLGDAVRDFCSRRQVEVAAACIGVPCPVTGPECRPPNLPWTISFQRIAVETGIPRTRILNDLAAIGHGIEHLPPEDLATLQEGSPVEGGARALLAAGTGLGEGFLTWERDRFRVHPSEGGHADLAPETELQDGLLRFLRTRFEGHVSYERVVSGPGLVNVYRFLTEEGVSPPCREVAQALAKGKDAAPLVSQCGMEGSSEACRRALDIFVSIYGAEAGNLALKVLATGGVYLAGGIVPHVLPKLREGRFLRAFRRKGRFAHLLRGIPVHVVTNERVGLYGAAAVAACEAAG